MNVPTKRTDRLSSFKISFKSPILTRLVPGLNEAHMWSFCSNSQHQSHFPNKILLQIKSALPNIKTSIDQKCNVCFTVCEYPNKSLRQQFQEEGGRQRGRYFPKWTHLYCQFSSQVFSLVVYLKQRKHLALAKGRRFHSKKPTQAKAYDRQCHS